MNTITLCNACNDHDTIVTQEWLQKKNLPFRESPFIPLSEHDELLMDNQEGGFSLFNEAWVRWTTIHVINDVKFLCFSDDNYIEKSDTKTIERFRNNLSTATEGFSRLANSYGVELNKDINESEYFIDVYVPIAEFNWIQSKFEFELFLSTCEFKSPACIEKTKKEIISKRKNDLLDSH